LAAFNLPPLDTLPARLESTSTFANSFAFKSAADKAGLAAFISATTPAT
jgi:hypothetical protein